ncbi:MAG: hypothetical protein U0232_12910 [Thermomicrobiales bacterium]
MTMHYDAFVLRYWQCDGERRVEVEHLQSGGRIRNATLADAATWIGAWRNDREDQATATGSPASIALTASKIGTKQ